MSYNGSDSHSGGGGSSRDGTQSGGKTTKPPKTPPPPRVPPTPYTPPTPFDWTSNTGRVPMDMASIMGGAMPLAGQVKQPDFTTAAPPVSGNFWDTVASPDMMLMAINSLPKLNSGDKGAGTKDPFGFGVDMSSILSGSPMSGKTGMPSGSTSTSTTDSSKNNKTSSSGGGMDMSKLAMNNPFMMQAFLQSPAYQKLQTVFSPSGVVNNQTGTTPFY